jgi:ADP-ribose pyrophosphatase
MVENMKYSERTISSEYLYQGRILKLRRDLVLLQNGKNVFREIIEHKGAAACLVLTPENKLIFVRQYRHPYKEEILEFPAGRLEKDEEPEKTIIRELQEEVGIKPLKIEKIGRIYPSPGYTDEIIHLYFTENYQNFISSLDEDEFLDTLEIPIKEAFNLLEEGKIVDSKTIVLLLKCKDRLLGRFK